MLEEGQSEAGRSPATGASLCQPWSTFRSPKNSKSTTNRPIIDPPRSAIRLKPQCQWSRVSAIVKEPGFNCLPQCRSDGGILQTNIFYGYITKNNITLEVCRVVVVEESSRAGAENVEALILDAGMTRASQEPAHESASQACESVKGTK